MMKNRLLLTASILAAFNAEAATFSAAVVVPADKPALTDEIASGLSKAFSEKGHTLKISYFEERCEPYGGRALFGKVLQMSPDFALGYSCDEPPAIERMPEFPVFLLGGTIPENANGLVKLTPDDVRMRDGFVKALSELDGKRFLLANDMTGRADELLKKLRRGLASDRFTEVAVPPNKLNENINNLSQYTDSNYNLIIVSSADVSNAVRLVSRIREAGLKQPIVGTGVLGTSTFSAKIGSMKEGIYFYSAQSPRFSLDAASVIADLRFEDKPAGDASVAAFAAAQIFLKQPQNRNFSGKKFKTVLGTLEFDADGTMKNALPGQFFKWVGNQIKSGFELVEK